MTGPLRLASETEAAINADVCGGVHPECRDEGTLVFITSRFPVISTEAVHNSTTGTGCDVGRFVSHGPATSYFFTEPADII